MKVELGVPSIWMPSNPEEYPSVKNMNVFSEVKKGNVLDVQFLSFTLWHSVTVWQLFHTVLSINTRLISIILKHCVYYFSRKLPQTNTHPLRGR